MGKSSQEAAARADPDQIGVCSRRAVVRNGLAAILTGSGFHVRTAPRVAKLSVDAWPVKLLLIDISDTPRGSIPQLHLPDLGKSRIPIVAFMFGADIDRVPLCLSAGYSGVISGLCSEAEIIRLIESVLSGNTEIGPYLTTAIVKEWKVATLGPNSVLPPRQGLTMREREVYMLLGTGLSNRRIAETLGVSVKTVETHKDNIRNKLGLSSASDIAADVARHSAQDYSI